MKKVIHLSLICLLVSMLTACSWDDQDTGTLAGGVIGGVAGNVITAGSTVGTIAGAVGGAFVGRAVTE